MTDRVQVQGWCPTAWQPMLAQDGWIVRVRPYCASVSVAQWRVLTELALTYALPQIELTRLGNVQLRGISEAQLPAVRSRLTQCGLVPSNADADLAPPVHCTPFYDVGDSTHRLAIWLSQAVVEHLAPAELREQGIEPLPSKFGFVVDDWRQRLAPLQADVHLWITREGRYALAASCLPRSISFGHAKAVIDAAIAIARWFARERFELQPVPTRLRGLREPLFARGLQIPELPWVEAVPLETEEPPIGEADGTASVWPGDSGHGRVGIAAPLGRINAAAMLEAALALPEHTEIRVTPWRSLLVSQQEINPNLAWFDSAHWITQPGDPRLRVSACTGTPGCTQALVPAQEFATRLAGYVGEAEHVHVSGCAKRCALSADATVLVCAGILPGFQSATTDAGVRDGAVFHISQARQSGKHKQQILPQALWHMPSQIQKIIHDLHLRESR